MKRLTLAVALAGAALASSACTLGKMNGDTVDGPIFNQSLTLSGYTDTAGETLSVQMRKSATDPSLGWEELTRVKTSLTQTNTAYPWSVTVKPVTTTAQKVRWPEGKLGFFRVMRTNGSVVPVVSFDRATWSRCVAENSNQSVRSIGLACARVDSPELTLASTQNNPADTFAGQAHFGYLGRHGDAPPPKVGYIGGTKTYYANINAPSTLTGFINTYFSQAGKTATATYYNDGELGVGREMHCIKVTATGDVACYVQNYGSFGGSPSVALDDATNHANVVATVAMVWKAANVPNRVQFIVYDGAGQRSDTAPLDSTGEHVTVPNNCIACHGIDAAIALSPNATTPSSVTVTGAAFLPFNPSSFIFSGNAGLTRSAQEDAFLELNRMVESTNPPAATLAFMRTLYGGALPSAASAPSLSEPQIPAAWTSTPDDKTLYAGVAGPFCLNCHMSSTQYPFDTPASFAALAQEACNANHPMPHAEHALRKFWNSGARVYLTQRYSSQNSTLCSP